MGGGRAHPTPTPPPPPPSPGFHLPSHLDLLSLAPLCFHPLLCILHEVSSFGRRKVPTLCEAYQVKLIGQLTDPLIPPNNGFLMILY